MLIAFKDTDSALGAGAVETVVMLVLPSHCSSHQGEQAGFDRASWQIILCETLLKIIKWMEDLNNYRG